MPKCEGCGALVIWTLTEKGKRMPVDAEPMKRVILVDPGNDVLATQKRLNDYLLDTEDAPGKGWLPPPTAQVIDTYVSHFATCPKAAGFRKEH